MLDIEFTWPMKRINILKQNLKKTALYTGTHSYSQILKVFPPFCFRSFKKRQKKRIKILFMVTGRKVKQLLSAARESKLKNALREIKSIT